MARELVYFCIDCESSGPVPALYNLISLGVVVVRRDAATGKHTLGAEKYWELQLAFPGWEAEAEGIHKLSREHLDQHGLPPKQVLTELAAFTKQHTPEGAKPVFVGHNAPFDWMMVNYYYHHFNVKNPYGYNALDTKAMATGKHKLLWTDSNKETLLELYPRLKAPAAEMVHNALADAKFQAEILVALLDD